MQGVEREREREKKNNQPTNNQLNPPPPAPFGETKSDRGSEAHGAYAQDCASCAPGALLDN